MIVQSGKFLDFCIIEGWEYAARKNCTGAAVIIAITPMNHILLVEQFRPPVQSNVIELPAGLIGDQSSQESVLQAAHRELLEETGFRAGSMKHLVGGPISAGMTSEQIHFVLAKDLVKEGEGGGVDGEEIQVHQVPIYEFEHWIQAKQREKVQVDPKIFMAYWYAKLQLES